LFDFDEPAGDDARGGVAGDDGETGRFDFFEPLVDFPPGNVGFVGIRTTADDMLDVGLSFSFFFLRSSPLSDIVRQNWERKR
jgi:hypothetical protein